MMEARLSPLKRYARTVKDAILSMIPKEADRNTAGYQAESLAYVFALGVLLVLFVGRRYLADVPDNTSFVGWVVTLIAFLATALTFNLLLLMATAPWAIPVRRWWLSNIVVPVLFGLLSVFVYIDCIVYSVLKFHINGMLLGMAFATGARESYTIGIGTWISGLTASVLIVAAMVGLSIGAMRLRRRAGLRRLRKVRFLIVGVAMVFAVMFLDKALYAWADIKDKPEWMRSKQLFPLYVPGTAKHFARDYLGMEIVRRESIRFDPASGSLDYPKAPLVFAENGRTPNVVIVLIEGARFDILEPEIMPFLHGWAQKNVVCAKHLSGGIESRVSITALIYGIYGAYYHRILSERVGPALVGELKKRGYAFRVLSCAPLEFCQFRKTLFVEVVEAITDRWGNTRLSYKRDRLITEEFIKFLDRGERPFFCFLFLGGSHQPYRYPPEHEVFPTSIKPRDVNYVKLATSRETIGPIFKRYKNSLHCIDGQLERIIGALEARSLLDDTLVFVSGDHGEEFRENGTLGHNSSYNRYQSRVIMVAHVPGEAPRKIERLTSHLDVVPTIFEFMGVQNPVSDFGQGVSLTSPDGPPFVFVASFYDAAVVDDRTISAFGLEAFSSGLRVTDWDCVPVPDRRAAIAERRDHYSKVLTGLRHFVK